MAKELTERNAEMKRLRFEEGWSIVEIGKEYGLSKQRIAQILGHASGFRSNTIMRTQIDKAKLSVLLYPHLYLPEIKKLTGIPIHYLKGATKELDTREIDRKKRFWYFVDQKGDDDCWEWTGCRNKVSDYGSYIYNNGERHTHRIAWILTNGKIPKGKQILHKCHNPPLRKPIAFVYRNSTR